MGITLGYYSINIQTVTDSSIFPRHCLQQGYKKNPKYPEFKKGL